MRELLPNNTTHFSKAYIKHYWHFQGVTDKQYQTLLQSSCQTTLIFSKSYWQAILHTFQELPSNKTDIFRVTTKQYWLIQSSCQTVFTLSRNYYQTIVKTFLRCLNEHLNRQNSQTENSQVKVRKVSIHTWNR